VFFRTASVFFIVSVAASAGSYAQSVMTRHMREEVRSGAAQPMAQMSRNQLMSLDLVLPLGDSAGLESFLADLYDPASPNFHHFLTVSEFTARFGPTQEQYEAVLQFAKVNGLAVTGGSRDGMDVQVKGSVAAIEKAFHVRMAHYPRTNGEAGTYYAPDREPTTDLPFNLWHVSGMDNYSIPHARLARRSDFAASRGIEAEAVVNHATTGSGPQASFLGSDMRAAYATGTTLTGAGQTLGLLEFLGTDLVDLNNYYKQVGQTNEVPITLISTDGTSTSCVHSRAGGNCDDTEQTLDMTQALGMAPGLASLQVYVGSTDTAMISAMVSHNPLPATIGCSWGWTPADPNTLDPFFKRMAAQGQNFFAASGDNSTWSRRNEAWPADDANVVSVGGTDLVTTGAAGAWKSETAWVDSGGGTSPAPERIAIPAYQKLAGVINSTNRGSTTLRNGPDVAANANFTFFTCANQTTCLANEFGGTSFAAPMWAGLIALVNEKLASEGKASIGFLNPTIYPANVTSNYATGFHDVTSGRSGSFSATTGYDLVTGWGSPKPGLINELAP
jgi:subtilase family serine protease